jgi:pyrroline-5-carboxylate reductase
MTRKLSGQKLAVLGAGTLGGILLRAYLKQKLFSPERVSATVLHGDKAATLSKGLGVGVTSDNRKAVAEADIVLLCMKPQVIREVLEEIRPHVGEKALVISVAASVPTSYIEQHLGPKVPVVRAMPNTCSAVGCGMTGICRGAHAAAEHLEMARAMFDAVGRTVVVDEKHMDAVTGLSASGPAFSYIILESLAGGSQSRPAARRGHVAGRADDEGLSERGAGDGRPSSAAERRGNDTGGLHD